MMKEGVATGLAIAMMLTTSVSAVDGKAVDERDRIESAPATRVGVSTRVSPEVGHGEGEWNSFWGWGRAVTAVWDWAEPSYLYASATVSADGCTDKTAEIGSSTKRKVTTEKVYQSEKEGRVLSTYHIVEGYWGTVGDFRSEEYVGEFEF